MTSSATTSTPALASAVITAALSQLGVKYAWGGESPGSNFDCSGLTQWAYSTVGIQLPRTSESQYAATTQVSSTSAKPGDLVFMAFGEDAGQSGPGHVGIYLGNGKFIDAPYTGAVIRVDSVPSDATYGTVTGLTQDAGSVSGIPATAASPTSTTGGTGCASQPPIFSVIGLSFSRCQAKALVSGLLIGNGAVIMLVGTMVVVAWGLGHTAAGRAAGGAVKSLTPVGRVATLATGAVRG